MILLLVFHSCGKEEGESEPKLLSKPGRIAAYVQEKSVIITWDAVKNADGYNIKRYRESVDQEYLSIGSVSSTSFVDYNPANGKNCYYVYSFNTMSLLPLRVNMVIMVGKEETIREYYRLLQD